MKGFLTNRNRSVADVALYSGGRIKLAPGVKTPIKEEVTEASKRFYAQLRPLDIIYSWELEKSVETASVSDEKFYESDEGSQELTSAEPEDDELTTAESEPELVESVNEEQVTEYTEDDLMRKRSSELKEIAVLKGLPKEEAEGKSKRELTAFILS